MVSHDEIEGFAQVLPAHRMTSELASVLPAVTQLTCVALNQGPAKLTCFMDMNLVPTAALLDSALVVIPILHVRKLRQRQVTQIVWGHTTHE